MDPTASNETAQSYSFKAETRQLLDILIHSLYTEREIFLRELISNASDALTRLDFELLTNRDVHDSQAELAIWIIPDEQAKTLTIRDTGIGMTADEMIANLGTIAQSGARDFISATQQGAKLPEGKKLSDLIGQFGVGFYSAFMVAEWIRVVSRSYRTDAQAAAWFCTGDETYRVEPAEKEGRGTDVIIRLKEDAQEFLKEHRLREIIRRHSDFIPFPIYLGEKNEQANRRTAIWRQSPREVEGEAYDEFYRQLTLDFEPPLLHAHMSVDAPVQMYALLFVPNKPERGIFSLRKDYGLKLYARKVLIQDYNKDLLPEYLSFVDGVVDSEDLPLNVSRESVQANRVMAQLKKLVTTKVLDTFKKLAGDNADKYNSFWESYGRFIKQGVAVEQNEVETLYPLLRFRTTAQPDRWSSLDEYVGRMKEGQEGIYYILGDDERSILHSPHLDLVKKHGYEVLLMADPMDAFLLTRLHQYGERPLANVATADLKLPETPPGEEEGQTDTLPEEDRAGIVEWFKQQLGERVTDVRMTDRLSDSPARLVDPEGTMNQEMQRVYRLLNREFDVPKKILELNPRHPILLRLKVMGNEQGLRSLIIEQVYEDALLIEGLHPNPAAMIERIQKLMEAALADK